jgi:hypothetical protein
VRRVLRLLDQHEGEGTDCRVHPTAVGAAVGERMEQLCQPQASVPLLTPSSRYDQRIECM